MENKALLWFKPNKIGWLLLRRGMPEEQQWKKLYCMIKGNYLFYIQKLNRPEPQGVLPLEGCVAEISHQNDHPPTIYCFIVIMKKPIFQEKIHIRANYMFATETIEDCQRWVDALNMASISPHIARLRLEFARQEMEELIIRLSNSRKRNLQKLKGEECRIVPEEDDPYTLQALANQLMELYHSMILAEDSKSAARKQIYATHHYITKLQEAIITLDESVEEPMRALIQNDVRNVKEKLKEIISLRCSIRDVAKEIEVLNGNHEYGPQVHVMTTCKSILQNTLKKIKELREETVLFGKDSKSPSEGELLKLCHKVNSIYENERALLQEALPKEKVEISAQQGRHYFCSLASYALVPILENHIQRKQDLGPLPEPEKPNTRWWITNKLIDLFSNSKPRSNIQKNGMPPNMRNQQKESEGHLNMHLGSLLLPHLQMGTNKIVSPSALLEYKDIQSIEDNGDSLFSTTEENDTHMKENNKDARGIDQGRDSLLSVINVNRGKDKENEKHAKGIKQEGYLLLPMVDDDQGKGKEIKNDATDFEQEGESLLAKARKYHRKGKEKEDDATELEQERKSLILMIDENRGDGQKNESHAKYIEQKRNSL